MAIRYRSLVEKRVEGVVMNGRWLDRPALDALLAEVERAVGGS